MKQSFIICFVWIMTMPLFAQNYTIEGMVYDELGLPLVGCHVYYNQLCVVTNHDGKFVVDHISSNTLRLTFSFIGYMKMDSTFHILKNEPIKIRLLPDSRLLNEIAVETSAISTQKTKKNEVLNSMFIANNLNSTLVNTLERLPGVNSMDIGANASKPVIRGMGFNRVVVSENGVKQEGQQWGADHGLEIDPFTVETVEIVKGASGIELGSDAIGGYIDITNNNTPEKNSFSGEASVLTKTVNYTYGGSFYLQGRGDKNFFKFRTSILDFADYSVPTDHIVYLTRYIPVYNNRLKNTAGNELDFFFQGGHIDSTFKSMITLSNVYQKSGFFPGSHGIPDLDRVLDDGDYRNIDFPYQGAKHLKLLSHTKYFLQNGNVVFDVGYQDNVRQEWSEFHTHYPNQSAPEENENMEFDFHLKTYSANGRLTLKLNDIHKVSLGTQSQWKSNKVDGYNFLLPNYNAFNLGFFLRDEIKVKSRLTLNAGLRYDYGSVETQAYFDDILYSYFISNGYEQSTANSYAQRSIDLDKNYHDISWVLGLIYKLNNATIFRMNAGKAFRVPTAVELGSNGIHHGSFRHEKGDGDLHSEKGYYLDGNIEWHTADMGFEFSPYIYYFSNYLYLNPSVEWSLLPHAGQIYQYAQTEALLNGVEFRIYKNWFSRFGSSFTFEYIYNQQLSSDVSERYPLPYTPPANGFLELDYVFNKKHYRQSDFKAFINTRFAFKQNRVAQNEDPTDGYIILGAGVSGHVNLFDRQVFTSLKGSNLFNTKYFNHLSYYRSIEIPELGRNIQLLIKVPF
jgi:iron complex outermembrane receptor protein